MIDADHVSRAKKLLLTDGDTVDAYELAQEFIYLTPFLLERIEKLEKVLDLIRFQDRVLGYPTGREWIKLAEKAKEALGIPDKV